MESAVPDRSVSLRIGESVYFGDRFAAAAHGARKPVSILNRGTTRADGPATHKLADDCIDILPRAVETIE